MLRIASIALMIWSAVPAGATPREGEARRSIALSPQAALSWPRTMPLLLTPLGHSGTLRMDGYHKGKPVSVWILRQDPTTMARKSVVTKEWELIKNMGRGTLVKADCQELSVIKFSCVKESRLPSKNEIHNTLWLGFTDVITMKISGDLPWNDLQDLARNVRIDLLEGRSPAGAPATKAAPTRVRARRKS